MTQLYKAIAETGGIPYYMEMNMKVEGGGPDGRHDEQDDGRVGVFPDRHGSLDRRRRRDDKFDIPAGYKVKDSK